MISHEAKEQEVLFVWARLNSQVHPALKWLNSSLNGVKLSKAQAIKAKRAGMNKGYPDINLPIVTKDYKGLYIELKVRYRDSKGHAVTTRPTPEQKAWLKHLNEQGYKALVCVGASEAIEAIRGYLNMQ